MTHHPDVASIVGVANTFLKHKNKKESESGDRSYEVYHPSAFGKCSPGFNA